ncbi:putative methyltransferase [Halovivax ruber XH-70]|uniref:Putative methyltransferase n=1 Tax=Halovivax ruber (strain DSM 18193 / JCM 13892 / XH-70) TaxID=797302 RepID=L0ICL9_HALRX|nr:class I SAM-dependent methyltransferase family protein [Halovivax ruber]AGB16578.1 putative methyltransferase [Halovivax ruber XH-70]
MEVPCVQVRRENGETTRQRLADDDLVADGFEITHEDGWLYIPVTDEAAVPGDFTVIDREAPERETQTAPADLLGFEPSYERLGRAVIVDEDDVDRAHEIADAIVASDLPVDVVLNKASKVKGETRVRDWEVLASERANDSEPTDGSVSDDERASSDDGPSTEVIHREYGHAFALDLAEVYFSPRLATERHRVAEQVAAGERVFDMFAGVGPYVIPMAARGAECVGVDVNPRAIEYLRENAARNDVAERVTAVTDDVRDVAGEYADWADRIVMNLPHSADEFVDSAVAVADDDCTIHFYDIQHEDDPFGPGERAIRAAAEPDYEVTVETRREVRSYAPHELNVCLDVRLTR